MTTTTLERYIPLPKAAKRLGISAAALQGLIDSGNIRVAQLNGTIAVAESELDQIIAITREQYKHLQGKPITVAEAVEKYNLGQFALRGWINRGYVQIITPGYGMIIDEADVAYCAAVYQARGGTRGARIFDKNGLPYQPKQTVWAEYQRKRRRKRKTGYSSSK